MNRRCDTPISNQTIRANDGTIGKLAAIDNAAMTDGDDVAHRVPRVHGSRIETNSGRVLDERGGLSGSAEPTVRE